MKKLLLLSFIFFTNVFVKADVGIYCYDQNNKVIKKFKLPNLANTTEDRLVDWCKDRKGTFLEIINDRGNVIYSQSTAYVDPEEQFSIPATHTTTISATTRMPMSIPAKPLTAI